MVTELVARAASWICESVKERVCLYRAQQVGGA